MTEAEQRVYEILDQLHIPYKRYEHGPVYTMEELRIADLGIEGEDCKNLFVRNRKGDKHYLVIIPGPQKVDLKKTGDALGAIGLSFASEERLKKYLGLTPGAVSPFGLINDREKEVEVVLDESLTRAAYVNFHPNINSVTITVTYEDFLRFLDWCGNKVHFVPLS
nr:prolyl-tRNA synthetase associated domain-containing protein [Candidatus Formimonas warabiya]